MLWCIHKAKRYAGVNNGVFKVVKFTNQYITDVTFEHTVLAWRTQKLGCKLPHSENENNC